jgi:hypothetical protein
MPRKVKVTNEQTLQQEILRLRRKARNLETELGDRVDYFKGNYGKMALNTVIPGSTKHKGFFNVATKVASFALQSRGIKSMATTALMHAVEFAGVRLGINLFDKFRKSRSRKKKAKAAAAKEAGEE